MYSTQNYVPTPNRSMNDTLPSLTELLDLMNKNPGSWVFATLLIIAIFVFVKTWYDAFISKTIAFTVAHLVTPLVISLTIIVTGWVGLRNFGFEDRETELVHPLIRLTTIWCYYRLAISRMVHHARRSSEREKPDYSVQDVNSPETAH